MVEHSNKDPEFKPRIALKKKKKKKELGAGG
jgi:hypothetical protein